MKRARFPAARTLLAWLPALAWTATESAPPFAGQPDIVVIMADDMGFSDIGCYGGEIHTPNLDRLADGGLRFTQFYNMGRCCPTRAALLTGLYPHQAGVGHMVTDYGLPAYRGRLSDRCVTLAEALARGGYRTSMVGKWHVTPFDYRTRRGTDRATWPLQRGFETFYGTLAGGGSFFDPPGLMRDNDPIRPITTDYYYTDAISDEAARTIRRHGDQERPLFLYVAYTCPHWPLHARSEEIARYEGMYGVGWDAVRRERLKRMVRMGLVDPDSELTPRDRTVPPWEKVPHPEWEASRMAVYAAQIDRMDQGVGRIVVALEETGRLQNTLLLFLADNGGCAEVLRRGDWLERVGIVDPASPRGEPMQVGNDPTVPPGSPETFASYGVGWANASNTPFRLYKHWVHEGGVATPLIVHWPRQMTARGELCRQPAHVLDIMATCLEVAAIGYPRQVNGREIIPLEGKSLVPAFSGRAIRREAIYWEHEGNRAVRTGDWKLVARHGRPWELYDLKADRTETDNLVQQQPELVERMIAMYERWARRCGVAPWPPKPP
ncbi:MAG: arylsulfatase [Pirellulales bacterium]|nr:arylsulfatase [Pirellulales bacterium]